MAGNPSSAAARRGTASLRRSSAVSAAALLLAWALLVAGVCTPTSAPRAANTGADADAGADPGLDILMLTWRGDTAAEEGFRQRLTELGYDVSYTLYDARQDPERLSQYLRIWFTPESYDYIYTFGTTVSLRVKEALRDARPQIFNIVAYPVSVGLVRSLERPGGSISGVSNAVPMRPQLTLARGLVPFRRLGVFFNPREQNGEQAVAEVAALGKSLGFDSVPLRVMPGTDRLRTILDRIRRRELDIDAAYLPTDSHVISRAQAICDALTPLGIAVFSAVEEPVAQGALMGMRVDYGELGAQAAERVHGHQCGQAMGRIPVGGPAEPEPVFNRRTARLLGIALPEPSPAP